MTNFRMTCGSCAAVHDYEGVLKDVPRTCLICGFKAGKITLAS